MTYPNVLVTEYLKKARRAQPDVLMRALELINLGYQRLLTFEVAGGGFDWYGKGPANLILSAWGLLQFADMAKVHDVDPAILERTLKFIFSKQSADGSWVESHGAYSWSQVQGALAQTAYIAWALLEAGQTGEPIDRAVKYLREHVKDAGDNAYILALLANVLKDESLLARLDSMNSWTTDQTLYFAKGDNAGVETTALVAMAMARSAKYALTAHKALASLVKARDANGAWGSTQATILALKALIAGMSAAAQEKTVDVVARVNGKEQKLSVTPDQGDVVQYLDFKDATSRGNNAIHVAMVGQGNFIYQIAGRYYVPWSDVKDDERAEPLNIIVDYDRTTLSKDDTLKATVRLRYNGTQPTFMIIADLGVPGGFTVVPDAFEKMQAKGEIDKFQITGRQAILYFGKMGPGEERTFSYELKAKFPIKVKTPVSQAYEYYSPERRGLARPVELEVMDK